MKRCPECRRDYYDDSLLYCLDDGTPLLEGPGIISDEPATAMLPKADLPSRTLQGLSTTESPHSQTTKEALDGSGKKALIIGALLLLSAVVIGFGVYKFAYKSTSAKPISFESAKLTRLTATGKASNVAISPDGKYVVHVQDDGGQQSLWVRQTATQSNVQIVAPAAVTYDMLAFTPDGNYVYYSVSGQQYPQRVLFQIPALGGTAKKVLEDLDSDEITFSPDGRQFAFIRLGNESALLIANADGTNERKLVAVPTSPESLGWPAWSPDGKRIAYDLRNYDSNDVTIFETELADGSRRQLTQERWLRITDLTWTADGSGLLALGTTGQSFAKQILHISYPDGTSQRLTNDLNDYQVLSVTPDSKAMAVVKTDRQANIWVAPTGDSSRATALTSGSGRADNYVSWSPNGQIVFGSNVSGDEDIWLMDADGGNPKQLTANARINRHPTVSPDGRTIVFLSDRSGTPHLWRMNIDGSDQRQLTNFGAEGEQEPRFSTDGRWIFYMTAQAGPDRRSAWRISADGLGQPTRITEKIAAYAVPSPDGQRVAYVYKDSADAPWRIAVAPFAGGEPLKTFPLPATSERPLRWTSDGRAIEFIDTHDGISNIVAQPIDGGKLVPVTDFKNGRIFWFEPSQDGKKIVLSRGSETSDVVLITGFR